MLHFRGDWAAMPQADGATVDEFGISWSDGLFSGPFATEAEALAFMDEANLPPHGITGRIVARTVEYGPWEDVA